MRFLAELYKEYKNPSYTKKIWRIFSFYGALIASFWYLVNADNYKDCVLQTVNLGFDTDTIAAIAGGLGGIYYGYNSIPEDWLEKIARWEYIEDYATT